MEGGAVPGRWAILGRMIRESPHNLVSAGDRALLEKRHLPEAMALAEQLSVTAGARWMDLGTGGGLPGLVLAGERPEARWTLVDARHKKIEAVRSFADALEVDCQLVAGRAEDLARRSGWRGAFEGVVARAVAPLRVLVELARGFLGEGGRLVAVKGARAHEELADAERALETVGMQAVSVRPLVPGGDSQLIELVALGEIPEMVPRRAGQPERKPL